MKLVLLLASVLLTSPSWAALTKPTTTCLPEDRYTKALNTFIWTSDTDEKGNDVVTLDRCDSENVAYQTLKAWMAIEDLPQLDTKADQFNQNALGNSMPKFVQDRIVEFVFDSQDSRTCASKMAAAYVILGGKTAYICPEIKGSSTLFIMDTLLHESRHVNGFKHQLCKTGMAKSESFYACDDTYAEYGSYGIGAEFNIRASRTPSLPEAFRAEARATAILTLMNNFNELPVGITEGVYGQSETNKIFFLDTKAASLVSSSPQEGILISRVGTPTFYDAVAGTVKTLISENNVSDTPGTFAENFRKTEISRRKELVDIGYTPEYSCQLYEKDLLCVNSSSNKESATIILPSKAAGFLFSNSTIWLKLVDGKVYKLPQKISEMKKMKIESAQPISFPLEVSSFVMLENISYGVTSEGVLSTYHKKGNAESERPSYLKILPRFKKVVGPAMWSPQLRDL